MLGQRFSSRFLEIASASAVVALRSGLDPAYGDSAAQWMNLVALPRPQLRYRSAYVWANERHRRGQESDREFRFGQWW